MFVGSEELSLQDHPKSSHFSWYPNHESTWCHLNDTFLVLVLGCESYDWEFESRQGVGIYLFTTTSRLALGPTSLLFSGYKGVKQSGHETDHSPPPGAEVKNAWSYISTP
jgi:hypothetical protein